MSKDKQKPQEKQPAQAPLPVEAAKPAPGWSSKRAEELVKAVPQAERELLLGDLLAQLAPLVGETGANETATDTLKRLIARDAAAGEVEHQLRASLAYAEQHRDAALKRAETVQSAMVARRAPDATSGARIEAIAMILAKPAKVLHITDNEVVDAVQALVDEWSGLRALLSPQPMRAVAVRDDSTPALAERYALMYVEWDGKRLNLEMLEGPSTPWMDLVRPMNHAVSTRLVPPAFR